jgi:hypothetical protein
MSEKYVVFSATGWDEFIKNLAAFGTGAPWSPDGVLNLLPEPVPDAEVFRHQDFVASTVFYSAASTYQSFLELVGHTMTDSEKEYMKVVIDHFFEAGEKSMGLPQRKLPD